jgi:hypothetical protein
MDDRRPAGLDLDVLDTLMKPGGASIDTRCLPTAT